MDSYLKRLFTYEKEANKTGEEKEEYTPTLSDTRTFLENLISENPIVYDFMEEWWKRITEEFSDEISFPEISDETTFSRLVPLSDESLVYMILSDLELVMEDASYSFGEPITDMFEAENWLKMIDYWEHDRELEPLEKRYTKNIMTGYVTYFSSEDSRVIMNGEMKEIFDKFKKELERM